jgi:hypothetical protein
MALSRSRMPQFALSFDIRRRLPKRVLARLDRSFLFVVVRSRLPVFLVLLSPSDVLAEGAAGSQNSSPQRPHTLWLVPEARHGHRSLSGAANTSRTRSRFLQMRVETLTAVQTTSCQREEVARTVHHRPPAGEPVANRTVRDRLLVGPLPETSTAKPVVRLEMSDHGRHYRRCVVPYREPGLWGCRRWLEPRSRHRQGRSR